MLHLAYAITGSRHPRSDTTAKSIGIASSANARIAVTTASKLGVNQQEMGALVQTSRQTISQIERGDYSPSVTLALKLAKACGVTVEDIFEYTEGAEDE